MAFPKNYAFFTLILFPCFLHVVHALNYATFSSGDGNFMLHWTYSNNKLVFNMTCKATGWCAVGFTENPGGGGMINYDIAAGGVSANTSYLEDYWSNRTQAPPKDAVNNFELVEAMEMGGYTSVKFERNLTTGESNIDVQFTMNTEVYIVWAMHLTTDADPMSGTLGPKHDIKGKSGNARNLIAEAMAAAITPTTTTMMMPSTSVVSTPQPTVDVLNYAMFSAGNGNFMLHWTYSNNKLLFNMTCKATGWCAVGFTENPGGRGMVNYDIAAGGVSANNTSYLQDYWSTSTSAPPKDAVNNFELVEATEMGGYTSVKFERNLTTGESNIDVQFTNNTEVYIAWAMNSNTDANPASPNLGPQHNVSSRGVSQNKQNLIAMAMAAAMIPTTTTMMMPSTSVVSTPQPTGTTVSAGDNFMLTWIYSNNKLMFTMKCKTTGWCAVAFTTRDGSGMRDYDIALGGVASGNDYLDDYWSTTTGKPSKDTNNFVLISATEAGGYTTVVFERNPETSDIANDVQFKPGTEVRIAWAFHSSMDGDVDISRHTSRGVLPDMYTLVPQTGSTSTSPITATTVSFGDKFMLTWIYSNNKLFFTLRCKTTGWCAVAFTTGDGSDMKDYDIALGGVASDGNYLDDYWSTSTTKPSKDSENNFVLRTATEAGGYTTVQFERDPETSDTDNDVQFKPGTEVMIAWAMHNSLDGNADITQHTDRQLLPTKYILVPGAANMLESRVMLSAILAAIVVCLVS